MFQPPITLNVSNARATLEEGLRAIEAGQKEIDFAQVKAVDSTAVATLLAWQRASKKHGNSLTFRNIPRNLKSLIDLYSVDGLLHH
ncbi:MAG TPA: STAS domain-containing protein [Burkholderiaceae bacterium]|jgi:phospholipid transport system transporter-binding protein